MAACRFEATCGVASASFSDPDYRFGLRGNLSTVTLVALSTRWFY